MEKRYQHTLSLMLFVIFLLGTAEASSAQLFKKKQKDRFEGNYVGLVIARVVRTTDGYTYEKKWEEYVLEVAAVGEGTYTVKLHVPWKARKATKSRLEFPGQTHSVPDVPGPYKINGGEASFYANCVNAGMTGSSGNYRITLSFNGCTK